MLTFYFMRFLILLLVLATTNTLIAQQYLYVHKIGKGHAYNLASGDEMVFRLDGEKHFRKDFIVTFTDTSIVFNYSNIPISAIDAIGKSCLGKADLGVISSKALKYGGGVYLVADLFNSMAVRGESFYLDKSTVAISSGMILSGMIISKSTKRFIRVRSGGYGLKILRKQAIDQ